MHADALVSALVAEGTAPDVARAVPSWIDAARDLGAPHEAWARLYREVLTPAHDFALHLSLYRRCYRRDDADSLDGPAWMPTPDVIARANVTAAARDLGLADYAALHRWSIEDRGRYWQYVVERLGIRLCRPYTQILDATYPTRPEWLAGARLNIIDSCFQADPDATAVIEWDGAAAPRRWTYDDLRRLAARVANALTASGVPAGPVGLVLPMTARSVAVYLGVLAAGGVVVSVADSFAADEIALRLRRGGVRWVFTQDVVHWGDKHLPLYEKVVAATAPVAVVLPAGDRKPATLRPGDVDFDSFLEFAGSDDRLVAVPCGPQVPINVLFSSGTTGEPKAIPWDHTTPIKCAADAHFHQDLHPGDVACWPTGLGWMMGPWLIFAALLNRATMALYPQAPTDAGFGRFVQDAGVTMLGLVPSLVRAWRQTGCMRGLDWTRLRAFSSTGECSNPEDMLYLMHLAGYRPVIEYCGGTEIGGAYLTGTVVQPCVPSAFSTPALGTDLVVLDEDGRPGDKGEVFIDGPSIGLSTRLLNRDNEKTYYGGTPPGRTGMPLRRHGDEVEALRGGAYPGYYRMAGRCDDTMNLGGIKVGCAEIERVLNQVPGVRETAAVALSPPGGGPSRLVVFLVPVAGDPRPAAAFQPLLQQAIRARLSPLFRVTEVRLVSSLPRTASNKVMRRELRAACVTGDLGPPGADTPR